MLIALSIKTLFTGQLFAGLDPSGDFPNLKSHFADIPKEESETKSGVMPGWRLIQPTLILHPEHFRLNDNPRDFVKEQIDKAREGLSTHSESKEPKYPSSEDIKGKVCKYKTKTVWVVNSCLKRLIPIYCFHM